MNNLLDLDGEFTWDFGNRFFIETLIGNFIWSDPSYGGDNTIQEFNGTYKQYIGDSFGRDEGIHIIRDYCGDNVKIIERGEYYK